MTCHSFGGNLTSSISDHFLQFNNPRVKQSPKFIRDFRNFNKREFGEELTNIDFTDLIDESADIDSCYTIFYKKIEDVLDYMAPYRKMTRKEIKLE